MSTKIKIIEAKKTDNIDEDELDFVIAQVGQFGKHQIGHLILITLPIILSAVFCVNFIVTSATDDYR